jgi:hypothetical protein
MPEAVAVRAIWEVTGGLIPGQSDPDISRRFVLTEPDWAKGGQEAYDSVRKQALDYLDQLEDHRMLNWVRLDWVWL